MADKAIIRQKAEQYFSDIVSLRRELHRHPELSKHEKQTKELICRELDRMQLPYRDDIYLYGVCALIKGRNPEKCCVALRSDMDALPIEETTGLEFSSENKGVMHACGHDVHMSSLLGAMRILNDLKDSFEGTVMCIFQPSEEEYPGGAISMIKGGVFNEVKPSAIMAFHCTPEMECGHIGIREGKMMASTDEIYITVKGKGGHGATPHLDIDPVVAACQVVTALQTIVSRNACPTMPTTFSVGRFIADGRTNIIPSEVKMECIIRTFNEEWRKQCHSLIHRIAENTAQAFGCEADVFVDHGYPFVYNDPQLTAEVKAEMTELLGSDMVHDAEMRMTAEDFAYFGQIIPACYFRIGTHIEGEPVCNLHTAGFNANENVLKTTMALEAYLALSYLEKHI